MTVQASSFLTDISKVEEVKKLGFSQAEIYRLVAPQRTLSRRKELLSLQESDRANRLEFIMTLAIRIFNSKEKANRWIRKPCRAMQGQVPIDLLISETGAREVEQELHRIDHGIFA